MDTSPSVLSHVVPLLSGTHSTVVVTFEYQQLFKFSTIHSTVCVCDKYNDIQWNPSITDTFGDQHFVRYSEVSPTQGLLVYFR